MVSHKLLEKWYQQLSQQIEAGIPLAEAILGSAGPPLLGRRQIVQKIQDGYPLHEVLQQAPNWLPRADRSFISAGHDSGRLPQTFATLSLRHKQIGANLAKVVVSLIYPLGMLHMAALVLPVITMIDFEAGFQWDAGRYFSLCLVLLAPCWALIGLILFLIKTEHSFLPLFMRSIPVLRAYSRAQALANFSNALGIFLETGMGIETAWQRSVSLSNDPKIYKAYQSIKEVIAQGGDPSSSLGQHAVFPADFVSYYTTGAKTGKLDQNLLTVGAGYQAQANQAMTFAAILYPTLLFAAVAGLIAYSIFKIYGGYLDLLLKMMEP
ncbi:MAG: type II secretory pathway component PulF [Lentimonas sp.]|jgi:type II secretory pathway component PulF